MTTIDYSMADYLPEDSGMTKGDHLCEVKGCKNKRLEGRWFCIDHINKELLKEDL